MLDLPRKKAQFPWPRAQSKPITSSGGLQISSVLLTHPSRALPGTKGPSLPSLQESTRLRLCVRPNPGMANGENRQRKPQRPSEKGDFPGPVAGRMRKAGDLMSPFATVLACVSIKEAARAGNPGDGTWLMGLGLQALGKDENQSAAGCLPFLHRCP